MADKWDQYATHEDKKDKWEQFATTPKSLSPLTDTTPNSFYKRHPYVSEGILGAASGVGIPETKTPVKDIGRGLAKTVELGPNELDKDPISKVMSYIPVAGPVYRMGAGLGEQTLGFGKDIKRGVETGDMRDVAHGAAGLTTEVLSLLWGGKKGGEPANNAANRMTVATGAFPEDIKVAQPDIEGAAATHGKPHDAAGLRDLTRKALDTNTTEFSTALQPIADKKVVPTQIADAIKKKVTPEMLQDAKGREMAKELLREATTYQKPWRLRDLYQRKQRFDAEGSSYFKKSETGKTAAQKTSVDEIVEGAVREGVKDILYPELDKSAGKPAGYFESLQKRQSALLKIKDAANKTVSELGRQDAMIKGMPMIQKITKKASVYAHPLSGRGGISLHKLNEPAGVSSLSFANSAARSAFGVHPIESVTNLINSLRPATATVLPRTNNKQLTPLQ